MQLFCAAACYLLTAVTPLQASKLACGSNSDACYAAFLCSLTETTRGLNSCICARRKFSEGHCYTPLPFRSGGKEKGDGPFGERRLWVALKRDGFIGECVRRSGSRA